MCGGVENRLQPDSCLEIPEKTELQESTFVITSAYTSVNKVVYVSANDAYNVFDGVLRNTP